jgi:hypothetical protein
MSLMAHLSLEADVIVRAEAEEITRDIGAFVWSAEAPDVGPCGVGPPSTSSTSPQIWQR